MIYKDDKVYLKDFIIDLKNKTSRRRNLNRSSVLVLPLNEKLYEYYVEKVKQIKGDV